MGPTNLGFLMYQVDSCVATSEVVMSTSMEAFSFYNWLICVYYVCIESQSILKLLQLQIPSMALYYKLQPIKDHSSWVSSFLNHSMTKINLHFLRRVKVEFLLVV